MSLTQPTEGDVRILLPYEIQSPWGFSPAKTLGSLYDPHGHLERTPEFRLTGIPRSGNDSLNKIERLICQSLRPEEIRLINLLVEGVNLGIQFCNFGGQIGAAHDMAIGLD